MSAVVAWSVGAGCAGRDSVALRQYRAQVGASQLALTVVTWAFAGSSDIGRRCCSGWQQLRSVRAAPGQSTAPANSRSQGASRRAVSSRLVTCGCCEWESFVPHSLASKCGLFSGILQESPCPGLEHFSSALEEKTRYLLLGCSSCRLLCQQGAVRSSLHGL